MKKLLFLFLFASLTFSCSKKIYVPVETHTYSSDTVERYVALREKVANIDSVTTERLGDTLRQTIVRERWHYLAATDSSRKVKNDTVRITRTVYVEKQSKKRSFSDWLSSFAKWTVVILISFAVIYVIIRRRGR